MLENEKLEINIWKTMRNEYLKQLLENAEKQKQKYRKKF